jgi:glycosyltransferase involved in cell wall biosynthesis
VKPSIQTGPWSFVIPCFNEATAIHLTISGIHQYVPSGVEYEIVVVDHGSTDDTVAIAEKLGATTVRLPGVSIGALRNGGAAATRGATLIYLDADISLTPEWMHNIRDAIDALHASCHITLTGSMAEPDPAGSWAGRHWEANRCVHGPTKAMGGAHLIIRKDHFEFIGGFPGDVNAGEDEDFCGRVRAAGGVVLANRDLRVVHRGVPRSLLAFLHRQFWHGLGDAKTFKRLFKSPMPVFSLAFLLLNMLCLAAILAATTGPGTVVWAAFALILTCAVIALASAFRRLRRVFDRRTLPLAALFWMAYIMRGLAVVARPFISSGRRWRTARNPAKNTTGPPFVAPRAAAEPETQEQCTT